MSDRAKLLTRVLETWENSDEGRGYLEWLLTSNSGLDGGDILREAVLDVMEDDEQLNRLRREKLDRGIQKFCEDEALPDSTAHMVKEQTAALDAAFLGRRESTRRKAEILRELRRSLGRDRIETLEIVPQLLSDHVPDPIQSILKKFPLAEELAAKLAALSRTSAEAVDLEKEWRTLDFGDMPFDQWLKSHHDTADGDFDYVSEELDRHYAHELVARLDAIIERASSLEPVKISIANSAVRQLFHSAHETYLHGFDAAAIALCRSLVEHSLKDKLPPVPGENRQLGSLIERAEREKLLQGAELASARTVNRAGNDVMHDFTRLRKTAEEVLDCTRIVLNQVYGQKGSVQPQP